MIHHESILKALVCLLVAFALILVVFSERPHPDSKDNLAAAKVIAPLQGSGRVISSTSLSVSNPEASSNFHDRYQTEDATESGNSEIVSDGGNLDFAFQVSTDYGYVCSTGDPNDAIQAAIETLPPRTIPLNIYLRGNFSNISNITLASNINFVGPAELYSNGSFTMFRTDGNVLEIYPYYWFADFISIYNVTFNGLHFIGEDSLFAIYGTYFNGQGWELLENFNVINSEFEGFYRGLCINPMNSTFAGNTFHDNIQSGLFFNFGADLQVYNNKFVSKGEEAEGLSRRAGLVIFDVFDGCNVSNNIFVSEDGAVGVGIVSSRRGIVITENVFQGDACAIDYIDRPFYSSDISFSDNAGISDFYYDDGIYNYSF